MNKTRTFSSVLMIVVGIALFATPVRSAVDVGSTTIPEDPCEQNSSVFVGFFDPCSTPSTRPEVTTTSTTAVTTTTVDQTTTTVDEPTTTTEDRPSTTTATTAPGSTTTAPTGVGGAGGHRPPTATQGGALARTGSSTAPMTAAGIALAGLGVVLLVAERRRAAGRI